MQPIAVIGSGYAGLCTAIAFAKLGHPITCVDSDPERVGQISRGMSPFYEPGLRKELTNLRRKGRITSTTDTTAAVRKSRAVFICVGTPPSQDGSLDSSQIRSASAAIGEGLRPRSNQLIVVKSTVLPGTTESIVIPTVQENSGLGTADYRVCVSPEFLQEGRGLEDSLHPSHVIIGQRDIGSGNALARLCAGLKAPTMRTSLRTAEAIKYATNAFLATKVTFADEIANLCTRLGLNADEVLRGMSMDPRISPRYLVPGTGFGGSCLPKDVRALVRLADSLDYDPLFLATLLRSNDQQPTEVVRLLEDEVGSLAGKRIAILGLAFKAGTDDVRETQALPLAMELARRGAAVIGYDPVAGPNFARLATPVRVVGSVTEALSQADGCIVQAPWPEFRRLGPREFGLMANPVVIDGRRTWEPSKVPKGIRYRRVG